MGQERAETISAGMVPRLYAAERWSNCALLSGLVRETAIVSKSNSADPELVNVCQALHNILGAVQRLVMFR